METNLNRNEKILAVMTLAAIAGFTVLFMQVNLRSNTSVSQIGTGVQVDYKMARPEESYSEYSLNGREIDQSYEALKRKEAVRAAEKAKAIAATKPVQTEAQKKAEAAKKKTEATQKAAALARSQAQTAFQARNKEKELAQQTKASSSDTKKGAEASDSSNYENQGGYAGDSKNPPNAPVEDPNAAKKKDKKTFAQWREQIFAQPTRESVNSFLEAYRKGDVTSTEVQAMAQDLLDQNSDSLKGLGLYTLRAAPSMASLSQLVHAEANLSATYKTYVEQAYLAYLQPQNVGYLNQALQTKDKTLIAQALTILNTNLPNVGKGNNSASVDTRGGRDTGVVGSNITMSSFKSLLPALTTLASSQEFASMAQQVMAYIESSNTVAQN